MNLRFFHSKIGKNYSWEFDILRMYRKFKDGISFFELNINWDKFVGDHNPQFTLIFILLNLKIFEFTIYNVWHTEDEQSPFYNKYNILIKNQYDGPNYE